MTQERLAGLKKELFEIFVGIPVEQAARITIFFEKQERISTITARIQERRDCIYLLERKIFGPPDINGFNPIPEAYETCMKDEIANHQAFIQDLEKELEKLNQ